MINPYELRTGNIIIKQGIDYQYSDEGEFKVYDPESNELIKVNDSNIKAIKEEPQYYDGVPLSNKLLNKIASNVTERYYEFFDHSSSHIIKITINHNSYSHELSSGKILILKYVHEIQNLYHDLFGKHLLIEYYINVQ